MTLLQKLEKIAEKSNTSLDYILNLYALEGIARRISYLPDAESVIIRGSLITRSWVYPYFRKVNDLDLMGIYPYDAKRGIDFIRRALDVNNIADGLHCFPDGLVTEDIWVESEFPGHRFYFPVGLCGYQLTIQADISYNDPLIPPPFWWEYPALLPELNMKIHTISPELALSWKVHGLFETWNTKGGVWRVKDLYDIFLIIKTQKPDEKSFAEALKIAFIDRKTPFYLYQRILDGEFGLSKGSRKAWEKFAVKQQNADIPENHLDVLTEIRKFLDPFFIELMK